MGKQYRLKVLEGTTPLVQLTRGRFFVISRDKQHPLTIKSQLDEWYREQAQRIFADLLTDCMKRAVLVGIQERPSLAIRIMQKRWGSCTAQGVIRFASTSN